MKQKLPVKYELLYKLEVRTGGFPVLEFAGGEIHCVGGEIRAMGTADVVRTKA